MRYRPDQSCQPVSSQTPNAIRSNRHGWWMVDGTLAAAVHIIYRMYIPYVIGYGHTRSLYVCYICSIHNILIVNSVAPCPRYCSKSDKGCMFLEVNDSNGLKNTPYPRYSKEIFSDTASEIRRPISLSNALATSEEVVAISRKISPS